MSLVTVPNTSALKHFLAYSVKQVLYLVPISRESLVRRNQCQEPDPHKIGGRTLFTAQALESWLVSGVERWPAEKQPLFDECGPFTVVPKWLLLTPGLTDRALRLYVVLRTYTTQGNRTAFPSRRTIAAKMGCGVKKADQAIAELVSSGGSSRSGSSSLALAGLRQSADTPA